MLPKAERVFFLRFTLILLQPYKATVPRAAPNCECKCATITLQTHRSSTLQDENSFSDAGRVQLEVQDYKQHNSTLLLACLWQT